MYRLLTHKTIRKYFSNFLFGTNADYLQSMYKQWLVDQNSVSKSLHIFFHGLHIGLPQNQLFAVPNSSIQLTKVTDILKLKLLIQKYRINGHCEAETDPLHLDKNIKQYGFIVHDVNFNPLRYGFTNQDWDREFDVSEVDLTNFKSKVTLRKLVDYLRKIYCGKIGFQFMHLSSKQERDFIISKIQDIQKFKPTKDYIISTFKRFCKQETFSNFLKLKFPTSKRFGIEGCDTSVSAIGKLIFDAAKVNIDYVIFGMSHRGRLNTLYSSFGKSAQQIIKQFQDIRQYEEFSQAGDVKYHLGITSQRFIQSLNKKIILSLLPNPSHLESVCPLVYGRTRAIQDMLKDYKRQKALGVIVHGDAAIAGQGVVYQSIEIQDLKDYTSGGLIHIVVNNQIGFTTPPNQSRSSHYCTQIAKVVGAPIFHVNAEQAQLVDKCMEIALQYRNKFNKDFFVDVVGYRRYGHNEQDQPMFTQPLMYKKIREKEENKEDAFTLFCKKIVKNGVMTQEEVEQEIRQSEKYLLKIYEQVEKKSSILSNLDNYWIQKLKTPKDTNTSIDKNTLEQLFPKTIQYPQDFNIHPTIKKIFQQRQQAFQKNQGLDWATMQSLSFASLLNQGYGVRLSGQDVQRGTFSHRHAKISDQEIDRPKFMFLSNLSKDKAVICNSHLSELGVLGFQYGYSITDFNCLVCWQAQFGDFVNGAQIMIDNYISSGESKWGQQSGITLLLPHGMDGQGPEHSSARMQRYLQLCDDDPEMYFTHMDYYYNKQIQKCNLQIVYCSTSANYFHVLRRQMKRSFRKPLILFNSKKLLKFKPANSKIQEIIQGTTFNTIYDQTQPVQLNKLKKLIFCTGQFYYRLLEFRQEKNLQDIAIVRIEQLAPFPYQELQTIIKKYNKDQVKLIWVQQEHQNHGAWTYVSMRMQQMLNYLHIDKRVYYVGRISLSSPAVGTLNLHKRQQAQLLSKLQQL